MQKFRDYIYCDTNRIKSFISQIPQLNKTEIFESYEKETGVEGSGSIKIASVGASTNEKKSINYSLTVSPLEQIINWVLDDKNAINYAGKELLIEDKDKLIIFNGVVSIPEMSENMELLNVFAKNTELFSMVTMSEEDKKTMSFIKESDNIPILLELDSDYIFNCNLKKEYIIGEKDDFLDNIDEEITVIGRIDKIYNDVVDVEIYDLSKEVFKINRAIRRKMPKESLEDAIIYENGPLVKITPIIIYR